MRRTSHNTNIPPLLQGAVIRLTTAGTSGASTRACRRSESLAGFEPATRGFGNWRLQVPTTPSIRMSWVLERDLATAAHIRRCPSVQVRAILVIPGGPWTTVVDHLLGHDLEHQHDLAFAIVGVIRLVDEMKTCRLMSGRRTAVLASLLEGPARHAHGNSRQAARRFAATPYVSSIRTPSAVMAKSAWSV